DCAGQDKPRHWDGARDQRENSGSSREQHLYKARSAVESRRHGLRVYPWRDEIRYTEIPTPVFHATCTVPSMRPAVSIPQDCGRGEAWTRTAKASACRWS